MRERDDRHLPVLRYTAVAFAVCILLWVGLGLFVYFRLPNWDDRGKVGDMFGAANALFSGLAFAGIVVTLLLQREQIALQRQDVMNARKELDSAERAQRNAEGLLSKQSAAISSAAELMSMSVLINLYEEKLRRSREPLTRDAGREAEYGQRLEELTRRLQRLTEKSITREE